MSYFTRLRDPLLAVLKEQHEQLQLPLRDRAEAARRAWEVRRARFGPGGGNRKGGGAAPPAKGKGQGQDQQEKKQQSNYSETGILTPNEESQLNTDLNALKAHSGSLEQNMPWAKNDKIKEKGVNTSGIVEIEGRKYFGKISRKDEAESEKGVWNAAKALGWNDMGRPADGFIREGSQIEHEKEGVVLNPLLPPGEALVSYHRDARGRIVVTARLDTSVIKSSKDKLDRMMLFEYAVGAVDRHGGNYWVDKKGELYGIDYGRSFVPGSDATKGKDPWVVGSGTYGGLWDRAIRPDRTIAREHIQHVLDNEEKLIAAIPKTGGFSTPYASAVAAMRGRMNTLRMELARNENKVIDLKSANIWKEEGRKPMLVLKAEVSNSLNAVDLYEYVTFVGTITLANGVLEMSGPDPDKLEAYVELARRFHNCQSDTAVWEVLPDMYHGTIHLRTVGNTAGTDEEKFS